MNRRHVLATAVLPLAGCIDFSGSSPEAGTDPPPGTGTPGTDPERTSDDGSTPDDGSTTSEAEQVTPETEYALGEGHADDHWRLAVETLDLATTFRTDAGERHEMPTGEQLLVARVAVENAADYRDAWAAGRFAAVVSGRADGGRVAGRPTLVVEHPAFADRPEGGLRVDDLARVDHAEQFDAQGYRVGPGERVDVWLVVVVPRELERRDVAVAFDGDFEDGAAFPVWWAPGTA